MFKDTEYYLKLDLDVAAARIPTNRDARLRCDDFLEVIISVVRRCDVTPLESERLTGLLGAPDRLRKAENYEVWEYDWIGRHGPDEYTSATPFVIRNGRVVSIEGRERD
jgi:hypothetical protein